MPSTITCVAPQGARVTTDLASWLAGPARDAAREETIRWIKRVRLVRYGNESMRARFTYHDESLWWFTEIYLHKMRRLDRAVATIVALDAACDAVSPARLVVETTDPPVREAAVAFGRARGIDVEVTGHNAPGDSQRLAGYLVGVTGMLSRLRPSARVATHARATVAAFVHTAFWRVASHTPTNLAAAESGPAQESYIGRVLDALSARLPASGVKYVGVGPRRNFRSRRWWDPVTSSGADRPLVTPIERLAPRRALAGSMDIWMRRHELAAALLSGPSVREAAVVRGCDLWAVLRPELEGAATVQWPWSARAMDEAGAAIDAIEPKVLLTYAEAGGWGRALVLEARRRGVPSVALQHGFIYRHWLNYLHEPDEMTPLGSDRGFPAPDRTLVFDRWAADHLRERSHFQESAVAVTGSAGLDDLAARLSHPAAEPDGLRASLGAGAGDKIAVLVAKFSEIEASLPALFAAFAASPGAHLIVKPHPAETA
ncbi:MAG: hypothetical protein ABI652_07125, partial [Acidobacteriota bacterium]